MVSDAQPTPHAVPTAMRAVVLRRFGGPEQLELGEVPVPSPGAGEVLLRVEVAGVGSWDPFEREGGYTAMLGLEPAFPYVLGSDAVGEVVAVGPGTGARPGERRCAAGFLNPKGGAYAEYVVVPEELTFPAPGHLDPVAAGVVPGVGLTALRGVDDVLHVATGDTVGIVGASGGIGHLAVQAAVARGARVVAVASGDDGVELVRALGAEVALDGRGGLGARGADDALPDRLDAALLLAGGPAADAVATRVTEPDRLAHPTGVVLDAGGDAEARSRAFNGEPDGDVVARLAEELVRHTTRVHVHRTYTLAEVADAHRDLERHHLGKLALAVREA